MSAADLLEAVRQNGLEGVVAKRRNSSYRPGDRFGDWVKLRANRRQELVIGGFVPASSNFDSILVGYYRGRDLMYAARIRAGFVPALRQSVFSQFRGLATTKCPFRNHPNARGEDGETALPPQKWKGASGSSLNWSPRSSFWNGRPRTDFGTRSLSGCGTMSIISK